jgi:LacI family gluconate utilization system Gnt-I transcriptional repressor
LGRKLTESDISMKDVAKLAGVATMTVSRALNSPERLSPDTLARVRSVIDAIGYVPNRVAGSLSSNRTNLVALIVPSLRNALYAETIQGISDVLRKHNLQLMISDSGYSLEQEEELIAAHIAQRPCGIILHNTTHTERAEQMLRSAGTPCVETGNLRGDPIDMLVSYSNFEAGKAMAAHLVGLGYRKFGFASLPVKFSDRLRERRKGFLAGLKKAGIVVPPSMILEVGEGLESGRLALAQLVKTDPGVRAVFFAGDVLAAGAVLECQRLGLSVPSRIAVAASDDNDLMQHTSPALTTVRFPRYRIGARSAELIVGRRAGQVREPVREDLGFEVIRRGST